MFTTTIISAKTLRLPKDVVEPFEIRIHGKLTGAYNEVVVVKQLRRKIFEDAYVCHVTEGPHGRGIYDMPEFQFIREGTAASIKRIGDINFTMACISEAINWLRLENGGFGFTNWLF